MSIPGNNHNLPVPKTVTQEKITQFSEKKILNGHFLQWEWRGGVLYMSIRNLHVLWHRTVIWHETLKDVYGCTLIKDRPLCYHHRSPGTQQRETTCQSHVLVCLCSSACGGLRFLQRLLIKWNKRDRETVIQTVFVRTELNFDELKMTKVKLESIVIIGRRVQLAFTVNGMRIWR